MEKFLHGISCLHTHMPVYTSACLRIETRLHAYVLDTSACLRIGHVCMLTY